MKLRAFYPLSAAALFLFIASLLVGCGGGGGGGGLPPGSGPAPVVTPTQTPVVTPGPSSSPIVVSGSLAFTAIGSGSSANVTFNQSGYTGAFTVNIGTCANIISVASGSGNAYTITPLSPGSCALSVTGSGASQTVAISVTLADVAPSVSWNNLGPTNVSGSPGSGKLNILAFDSTNGIYYAGGGYGSTDLVTTEAGLFKSTNGGASWQPIMSGLSDPAVNALWINPSSPSTLVVATQEGGIFRSTNGGASWAQTSSAPNVTQLLFLGTTLYAGTANGVLASSDQGATWTNAYTTGSAVGSLATSGGVLYVGTLSGSVYKASGTSLTFLGNLPSPSALHQLLVDPVNSQVLYASQTGTLCGFYDQDLWVSSDGGASWTENSQTCNLTGGVHAMAFDPNYPDRLYVLGYGGAYSDDHGSTLTHFYGVADARGLSILPGTGARFLATSDQGAWTSSDGVTFTSISSPLNVNLVRSVAINGNTVIVSRQDWYPAASYDGGTTWSSPSNIDSSENGNVTINQANPQYCYEMDREVNVSSDGCHTFTKTTTGHVQGSYDPQALVVNPSNGSIVYALAQDGAYESTTWGASFSKMSAWPANAWSIAGDSANAQHLYLGTLGGVYTSTDGGATWTQASGIGSSRAVFIAVSPNNAQLVVAATLSGGVYRSIDGGHTFMSLGQSPSSFAHPKSARALSELSRILAGAEPNLLAGYYGNVTDIAFNTTSSTTADLVMTTTNGAFASSDLGSHWHEITNNAISHYFENVKWINGNVYVATDGQGVIVSSGVVQTPNARSVQHAFVVRLHR